MTSWLVRGAASAERMRALLWKRGYSPNGYPLWQAPEEETLRGGYPRYDLIDTQLRRRTRAAAYSKAGRIGITKPKNPPWDENEIPRLRRLYSAATRDELTAAFPGRSFPAICRAANSRGIYKAPKPPKPTGNRVLDQVLARANSRNVSRAELDSETRAKGYFSKQKWRNGNFRHEFHFRAVEFLGGQLRASWGHQDQKTRP